MSDRQRSKIIQAGLALWREAGIQAVTARGIGKRVGLSHAGVIYHFNDAATLVAAVKAAAVAEGDKRLIPQLITSGDALVADWPQETRQAWLMAG